MEDPRRFRCDRHRRGALARGRDAGRDPPGETAPAPPEETLFEAVTGTVFRQYERRWKAETLYVNRRHLRNQTLPRFSGRPIAEIDSRDVRRWFASLHATPVLSRQEPASTGF